MDKVPAVTEESKEVDIDDDEDVKFYYADEYFEDDNDLPPINPQEDNTTIKIYPGRQKKKNIQLYTPSFENKDYQDGTTNTNFDNTEITPISEYFVVE